MLKAVIVIVVVALALVFATACVRTGNHSVDSIRDALREGVAFCNAHGDKLDGALLTQLRRSYEKRDWKSGAVALLDALEKLRNVGVEVPDRVILAEAIARGLLNSKQ